MAIKAANITSIVKTSSAIVNRGKDKSSQQVKPSIQLVSKSKVNAQNQGVGGALVKKSSFNVGNFGSTSTNESYNNVGLEENVIKIKIKVISIEKLLRGAVAVQKKQIDERRRDYQKKSRTENENKLEKTPKNDTDMKKLPGLPGMGFLEGIKNFFLNMIIGWFALKMIDYLPQFTSFLKILAPAVDFLIDFSGKFLDGLVTFVDWGYKAYDFTRKAVKDIGGLGAEKAFDQFSSKLDTFINLAIIAGMIAANSGGNKPKIKSRVRPKPGEGFRSKVTESGGKGLGRSDIRNPLRERAKVTSSVERNGFKNPFKESPKVTQSKSIGKSFEFPKITGRGLATGVAELGVGVLADMAVDAAVGKINQSIISGKVEQAKKLPSSDRKKYINRLNQILKEEKAYQSSPLHSLDKIIMIGGQTESELKSDSIIAILSGLGEIPKYAEGGAVTRGGKITGGIQRTVGTIKRKLTFQKPPKKQVEPGSKIGGEDKIKKLFPEGKDKEMNPFGFLKNTAESFNNVDYLGPIFGLVTKSILGEKIEADDYKNVGMGINAWISQGINDKKLNGQISAAFANGGVVDIQNVIPDSNDISDWAQQSAKDLIATKISSTSKDLLENLLLKPTQKQSTSETGQPSTAGQYSPEGLQGDIYQYLLSKGLDDNKALGIMANISRESGFTPGASQSGGPGVGLFQYSDSDRKPRFLKAVPDYATNWKAQIDYALKEDYAPQYLKQSFTSAQEAADVWMRKWERPAEYIQSTDGPRIHKEYLASLEKYKTKSGYDIPGNDAADIGLGKGYGDKGVKIAGDLGRFIYKTLKTPQQFQAVTEHPDFGGISGKHASSGYRGYHKSGRAVDIGAFANEQGSILKAIAQFNQANNLKPVELFDAKNDPTGEHQNHVHVAYQKGGLVGRNYKNLQSYASYEDGSAMTVIVNTAMIMPQSMNNGDSSPMTSASSKSSHHDPFEILQRLPG